MNVVALFGDDTHVTAEQVATARHTLGVLERWVPSDRAPDTYAHRAANQRQVREWLIANATHVPEVIR